MAGLASMIIAGKTKPSKAVDRKKICPLLLRVFYSAKRHHSVNEFAYCNVFPNELHIYTWMDATLRELTMLVCDVMPKIRQNGTSFDFCIVHANKESEYEMRGIGLTCYGQKGADDSITLEQAEFMIGDFIDVKITYTDKECTRKALRRKLPF